jgi:ankyrin repeat protein
MLIAAMIGFVRSYARPAVVLAAAVLGLAACAPKPTMSYCDAVRQKNYDELKANVRAGNSPNERCGHEGTALHVAVRAGDLEAVQILLDAGASANDRDEMSQTPLHVAADVGNAAILKALLAAHPDVNAVD